MPLGPLQKWPREPTEGQKIHMARITEACELLRMCMHEAEGSSTPEHQEHEFMGRRMKIAATHLEAAEMFARKAALE